MFTQSSNTQQVFASFMRFLPCVQNNDADKVKLEIVPNDKQWLVHYCYNIHLTKIAPRNGCKGGSDEMCQRFLSLL